MENFNQQSWSSNEEININWDDTETSTQDPTLKDQFISKFKPSGFLNSDSNQENYQRQLLDKAESQHQETLSVLKEQNNLLRELLSLLKS